MKHREYKPRISRRGQSWVVEFSRIPGTLLWVGPWYSPTFAAACRAVTRWYRSGNPMGIGAVISLGVHPVFGPRDD